MATAQLHTGDALWDWTPPIAAAFVSVPATANLPAWAAMWALCFSLYGGFKWLTWRRAMRELRPRPAAVRSLAYLVFWPGMNAAAFLAGDRADRRPPLAEWLRAVRNMVAGAAVIWGLLPALMAWRAWAAAWAGLVGIGLLLHFGALHLISLAWRRAGLDATPLMQRPAAACSLSEFWGRRWNTAFRDLAFPLVYQPLARRFGVRRAMAAVFLFSGVLHDAAISLPARAGFGLPTLYFLVQAIGVEIERSKLGRRWRLRSGVRGWLFAALTVLGPAWLLFHPPFMRQVVLPFLTALGA